MALKDISGNQRVKSILSKALKRGRIPGAMMLSGPAGVGKRNTALVVAKALNCLNNNDDACENCAHCRAINKNIFPDVLEIKPEKNVMKIEQVRELKQIVYLKPMSGRKKIFIINPVESMNAEAANSILKVLEEPPEFSHLILLTENPFRVLSTIKSRCQKLTFTPVSRADIQKALLEKGLDIKKARILSLMSRGNLRQALDLDWKDAQQERRNAWKLFVSFREKQNAAAFFKKYSQYSRSKLNEEFEGLLEILASFVRDLILLKTGGDKNLMMNPDLQRQLEAQLESGNEQGFLKLLEHVDNVIFSLQKNLNVKIVMESMASQLMDNYYA